MITKGVTMPKKQTEQEPRVIHADGEGFTVAMSPKEADNYPLLSYHTFDEIIYQVVEHRTSGKETAVRFVKA